MMSPLRWKHRHPVIVVAAHDSDARSKQAADYVCDGTDDDACATPCAPDCTCVLKIPTVSQWGLAILVLLLLAGAKVYFGRRRLPMAGE